MKTSANKKNKKIKKQIIDIKSTFVIKDLYLNIKKTCKSIIINN